MDDIRLSNLLFLAGIASLAVPGCGGNGGAPVDDDADASNPPGNPLEFDNSLSGGDGGGAGGGSEICAAYASRQVGCGGYYELGLQEYVQYCEYLLDYIGMYGGPDCRSAYAELLACISTQECDSFACSNAEETVDELCGDEGQGGESGG